MNIGILAYFYPAIAALGAYIFSFFFIYLIKDLPRLWFVLAHYAIDIAVFGGFFSVYFKYFNQLKPFTSMIIALTVIFALEIIFWNFIYRGSTDYLNFFDWMLPAFLIASTIYLVGINFAG